MHIQVFIVREYNGPKSFFFAGVTRRTVLCRCGLLQEELDFLQCTFDFWVLQGQSRALCMTQLGSAKLAWRWKLNGRFFDIDSGFKCVWSASGVLTSKEPGIFLWVLVS